MKWVYIIFGILGGLVPGIYIFSRIYANPLLEGLDLVLLSLGIGVLVTPLFMGAGLVVARLIHMALGLFRRYRGGHRFLTDRPKGQPATGASWVDWKPRNNTPVENLRSKGATKGTDASDVSNRTMH